MKIIDTENPLEKRIVDHESRHLGSIEWHSQRKQWEMPAGWGSVILHQLADMIAVQPPPPGLLSKDDYDIAMARFDRQLERLEERRTVTQDQPLGVPEHKTAMGMREIEHETQNSTEPTP